MKTIHFFLILILSLNIPGHTQIRLESKQMDSFRKYHAFDKINYSTWFESNTNNKYIHRYSNPGNCLSLLFTPSELNTYSKTNPKNIFNYQMIEDTKKGGWQEALYDAMTFGLEGFRYWYSDWEYKR